MQVIPNLSVKKFKKQEVKNPNGHRKTILQSEILNSKKTQQAVCDICSYFINTFHMYSTLFYQTACVASQSTGSNFQNKTHADTKRRHTKKPGDSVVLCTKLHHDVPETHG